MLNSVLTSLRTAKVNAEEAAKHIKDSAKKYAQEFVGAHQRKKNYEGSVVVKNVTGRRVYLHFSSSSVTGTKLGIMEAAPGETVSFDPGVSPEFDYLMTASAPDGGARRAKCNVVRTAAYRVVVGLLKAEEGEKVNGMEQQLVLEEISPPQRKRSDRLAATPGLSFSFSASGWLFVYQLGAAACLQDHGIGRNPHVRVSGASGGALTVATMMYGCDMRALCEQVKRFAAEARSSPSQAVNLRFFILQVMKSVVRDGSVKHPAFQSGRVEIAVSESGWETSQSLTTAADNIVTGKSCIARNRRVKDFQTSADAVIAMLASATMGISGLPFKMKNSEGKEVRVADGAFTEFLPTIDDNSVTVKSFSDGFNLASRRADVAPTEFVPGTWGLLPPSMPTVDHLFELGYRDMEAWIEENLEERIEQAQAAAGNPEDDLPPVQFVCEDDGMEWLEAVLSVVPISLSDQLGYGNAQEGAKPAPVQQPRRFQPASAALGDGDADDAEGDSMVPAWSMTMSPPASPRVSARPSTESLLASANGSSLPRSPASPLQGGRSSRASSSSQNTPRTTSNRAASEAAAAAAAAVSAVAASRMPSKVPIEAADTTEKTGLLVSSQEAAAEASAAADAAADEERPLIGTRSRLLSSEEDALRQMLLEQGVGSRLPGGEAESEAA